jgi:hypothetical protein
VKEEKVSQDGIACGFPFPPFAKSHPAKLDECRMEGVRLDLQISFSRSLTVRKSFYQQRRLHLLLIAHINLPVRTPTLKVESGVESEVPGLVESSTEW